MAVVDRVGAARAVTSVVTDLYRADLVVDFSPCARRAVLLSHSIAHN